MTRRALVLMMFTFTLVGCGYTTQELYPDEYRTVASPIFDNRTFYREVEFDLAEALKKEIEKRTPYKIGNPGHADTILQGTIIRIEQNLISRRKEGNVPEQVEVTMIVDFEWKDLRSGQTIVSRPGFSSTGWYASTMPVSEPFSLGQHQMVERMARDIVSSLRADW